jgi:enoyl-CoA hydratase
MSHESVDASFETLDLVIEERVARLTLSRPDKRNAMSRLMLSELVQALQLLEHDKIVRVTILAGAGASFSSGFDVSRDRGAEYSADDSMADYVDLKRRMLQLFSVWEHPKPIIAVVHGHCVGAATILATLADITIVSQDARIGIPNLPLGGGMIPPTWVHLIGPKRAKQIAFQVGGGMSGEEAVQWGWANFSAPPDQVHDKALELAREIARTPTNLLILNKEAVNRMTDLSGFRLGALLGPLTDSLAHEVGIRPMIHESIRAKGVKQTVEDFRAGLLDT